jgi:hypothetical protein
MNDETDHRDANTGIGHIESRPRVSERQVQIKQKKIDDVPVEEPIGQVSQDPGQEQGKRDVAPLIYDPAPDKERHHDKKGNKGEDDEKIVVVSKRPKGRPGVGNVYQIEKPRDDSSRLVGGKRTQDERFGDLIQGVQRQGEKQDELHLLFPRLWPAKRGASIFILYI